MNYDRIVVGAGISGLLNAVSLIHDGYKVLLLDEHNNIGGMSKKYRKGRFLFGGTIHNLYLNSDTKKITLNNILKKYDIKEKLNFSKLPNLYRVITNDVDLTLPFGINEYIDKIESIVTGSKESLEVFFKLAFECKEAMNYISDNLDNIDYDYLRSEYNNFVRVSKYSVSKVMDAIGVPLKAQEIINAMWVLWGSSETEISFVTYGVFLYDALSCGLSVLDNGNYDIALCLANNFLECGGVLKLNSKVQKLLIDEAKVNGVRLVDGTCYYADQVIINSNEANVYSNLIALEDVPKEALCNINRREFGGRTFTVHLGLNRSKEELGLDNYFYFMYESLDTDVEYEKMKSINCTNQVAIVHNNLKGNVNDDGTCMISLNTVFFGDAFSKVITKENVFDIEQEIAANLIDAFQKYTNINIYDFIEEILILSPLSTASSNGTYDGADFGFKLTGLDDVLPRLLNKENESYIEGLKIVSGIDGDAFGYASSYATEFINDKMTGGDVNG